MSKRVNLKAIQFSGISSPHDEIEISDTTTATSFSSGNGVDRPFTISFWLNLETINFDGAESKHAGVVYSKFNRVNKQIEMEIYVASGKLYVRLYADPDQNGTGVFNFANVLRVQQAPGNFQFYHEEDTWFHTCVTYDGSQEQEGFRIYKNSHPVGQAIFTDENVNTQANPSLNVPSQIFFGQSLKNNYSGMMQTITPTTLGCIHENDARDRAIAGKLADICRFNRVLTHAEVQELYNGGKVKNMKEHSAYDDLVHWWKMGDDLDGPGTNGIIDYFGGYHGTMKGNANIVTDPSLPTDRVRSEGHIPTSWGRTRQPKNIANDHQVYIHGGLSGAMPKTDPSLASDGHATEGQRYLHTYWKAEQTNKTHEITVFGFSYATGTWALLKDVNGNTVTLNTTNAAVNSYRIFEISGIDKVYFKSTGTHDLLETDLFAAACSSFQ